MADVFTKAKRSEVMSLIRSRGNRTTEWKIRARLISVGLSGWKLHYSDVIGQPDFAFPTEKVAVFLDGCFWHGCRKCGKFPASNQDFWTRKIEWNRKRDREVTRALKKAGWAILRLWEHQIKREPQKCIETIRDTVRRKPP